MERVSLKSILEMEIFFAKCKWICVSWALSLLPLWPPPWPRKGGGQCPHSLYNYVTWLLVSPSKNTVAMQKYCMGVTRTRMQKTWRKKKRQCPHGRWYHDSKNTAWGVTKTLHNICKDRTWLYMVLVLARPTMWCHSVAESIEIKWTINMIDIGVGDVTAPLYLWEKGSKKAE